MVLEVRDFPYDEYHAWCCPPSYLLAYDHHLTIYMHGIGQHPMHNYSTMEHMQANNGIRQIVSDFMLANTMHSYTKNGIQITRMEFVEL